MTKPTRCIHCNLFDWKVTARRCLIQLPGLLEDVLKHIFTEALTTSWSTGEPGPIAYCIAEGVMNKETIVEYNSKNHGRSMILTSGTSSHFMSSETFLVVLEQLFSPAFEIQRNRWETTTFSINSEQLCFNYLLQVCRVTRFIPARHPAGLDWI